MRSVRTPAAVLLTIVTAFLLCCGLTAEPHYMAGIGHPDPPLQFISVNLCCAQMYLTGANRAIRRVPLMLTRQFKGMLALLAAALLPGLIARLSGRGSRRRLMIFYINSPKLAPPGHMAASAWGWPAPEVR